MGGRHTYAFGNDVPFKWETIGFFQGYKVLQGTGGIHKLPEEAHSSEAYVQLFPDGNLQMIRFYDKDHFLTTEIAYHPEPKLTGHRNYVYHIHEYGRDFTTRSIRLFTQEDLEKYGKYLTMEGHLK